MQPLPLVLSDPEGMARSRYLLEQGIPVHPMTQDDVASLRLIQNNRPIDAEIQTEDTDAHGNVRWVMVTAAVDVPKNKSAHFSLESAPDVSANVPRMRIDENGDSITITTENYTLELKEKDEISLKTASGTMISGRLDFSARGDSRSFVSGTRTLHHRPQGFTVEEKSRSRCLIVWKARIHPDVYREYAGIDERRYLDCELEIKAYAAAPIIRLKWSFTNNYYYPAALERYAFTLPLSKQCRVSGDWQGDKFGKWASVQTEAGPFTLTAPFLEDYGPGMGLCVEKLEWIYDESDGFAVLDVPPDSLPDSTPGTKPAVEYNSAVRPPVFKTEYRLAVGGINPPVDGAVGADHPQVHRTLLHGMSRSFSSSLILTDDPDTIAAELEPIYLTVPAQHYSDTHVLPERGEQVTLGDYTLETERAADWLEKNQWRNSLYCGEWWREYDIDSRQGIEESGSGNSSLGVFYHYLRTGESRFLHSARRSMQAIADLTVNKQHDGLGPFVHTRRFLLDRENWHHPRYQRIAGLIRPSHIFCDRRARRKVCEVVRWFAEHFLDTDGAPMDASTKDPKGPKNRCTEAAMAQFCETLILAYHETGDEFFLEKARLIANWAVDQMESYGNVKDWLKNWNIQFVQRGLLAVILTTGEQKLIDAYLKICENILRIKPVHDGYRDLVLWEVHFVVYFAWHFAEAHRITGDDEILKKFVAVLETELARQVEDGTFPYVTAFVPRTSQWISYYDVKTAAAYLPVLSARLKAAGISRSEAADTPLPWEDA